MTDRPGKAVPFNAAEPGAVLTCEQMYALDRAAMAGGPDWDPVPGPVLMENAGRAVAEAIRARYPLRGFPKIKVLCGPGNNGGDGFVAARYLDNWGYTVRLSCLVDPSALKGDAASMAARWRGDVLTPEELVLEDGDVVIDALFGAGLSKPLAGHARDLLRRCRASEVHVVSVDIPSGWPGDTGACGDAAFAAALTVTFHARKPAHCLAPCRFCCGEVVVADIGIPEAAARTIEVRSFETIPERVAGLWPQPDPWAHKYRRGHAVVVSGPSSATGAARLAAGGALRAGAGLVTLASPPGAVLVNAAHSTAVMVRSVAGAEGLRSLLEDPRFNTVVLGPGMGVGEETAATVETVLSTNAAVVLDADALTSFTGQTDRLVKALTDHAARDGQAVLTPHEGEFERLLPGVLQAASSGLEAAREGAAKLGAAMLLKGPSTVIAEPAGLAAINTNAPPWLATAGSGDVLAGIIGGLLAQGLPAFEAALCGAFAHGAAGRIAGPGLIAADLPEKLPEFLRSLG